MSRAHDIIQDTEDEYGVKLGDTPDDILCDGDTCRHPECDCWGSFRAAIERQAMVLDQSTFKALIDVARAEPDEMVQFFKDYDNARSREDGDGLMQELQERAHSLNITTEDWKRYYAAQDTTIQF